MNIWRSLRVYIFLNVLFAALVVLFANRMISQSLLQSIIEREQTELLLNTVRQCGDLMHHERALQACVYSKGERLIDNFVTRSYVVCISSFTDVPSVSNSVCAQRFIPDVDGFVRERVLSGSVIHQGQSWIAAQLQSGSDRLTILVPVRRIEEAIEGLWSVRDQLLWVSIIPLFVSLILVAIFISIQSSRAINAVGRVLDKLHPDHLDKELEVSSPFKEFDEFVGLFKRQHSVIQDHVWKSRRFVFQASHELRTPLTIMRGNTDLLMADLDSGSIQQQKLVAISDQVEELVEIIDKLLLLHKADEKRLVLEQHFINFSNVISSYLDLIKKLTPAIEFDCNIFPNLFIKCEVQLIKQLLSNLISNAIKYNVPGGWVRVNLSVEGEYIYLVVINPSSDIKSGFADYVFDRFFRDPRSRSHNVGGHGLGLSICREIARAHGAELTASVAHDVVSFKCRFILASGVDRRKGHVSSGETFRL